MTTYRGRVEPSVLEAIVDRQPVMVALFRLLDGEFVYAYVNHAYHALQPRADLIGLSMAEVWPETADTVVPAFRGVYDSGDPLIVSDAEFTVEATAGHPEKRQFSFEVCPLDVNGERFLLEVADDVTGLVDEREDASAVAKRLEEVLGRMTDAVAGFDIEWRCIFMNKHAEQVLSKGASDLVGKVFWAELPEMGAVREKLERAAAEQQPAAFREHFAPTDTWLDVRGYPSPSGMTVFFADATDAVRAEAERQQTLEALEEKDRAIRQAYSDVIDAATGGRLVILGKDELDSGVLGAGEREFEIRDPAEIAAARAHVNEVLGERLGEDTDDMTLAVSEGLTNMLKHAGGGTYRICLTPNRARVVLADRGHGIDFRNLPRATLVPGYSTSQTLGMGFTLMMELCDQLLLSTDENGTVLVLEKDLGDGSASQSAGVDA